eukprot:1163989_1
MTAYNQQQPTNNNQIRRTTKPTTIQGESTVMAVSVHVHVWYTIIQSMVWYKNFDVRNCATIQHAKYQKKQTMTNRHATKTRPQNQWKTKSAKSHRSCTCMYAI